MSTRAELTHWMYDRGFWYTDPFREIKGLDEAQLFWVPAPNSLCALWHVGHIAHRERLHIGRFLQGIEGPLNPPAYDVFGHEWASVSAVREAIGSVDEVLDWVRGVRAESHAYIDTLNDDDFDQVLETCEFGLSVAHWLQITACHTALHIGRIQMLRALIEGTPERAC